VTIPATPRRTKPAIEAHLGKTSSNRTDGDVEATLIVPPDGTPRVRLTRRTWGPGVGWYAQHSLELGVEEAQQIAALLSRAPSSLEQAAVLPPTSRLAPESERRPVDLAAERRRRGRRTTGSAPGPDTRGCPIPTPIARRGRDLLADQRPADV
jgi:hypothetical protein